MFLGLEESGDFEDIRQKLEEEQQQVLHKEEHLNDAEKNQIWNFCLLDEHTNRSYGNSVFPVKRRIIMGKEMGKEYILNDDWRKTLNPMSWLMSLYVQKMYLLRLTLPTVPLIESGQKQMQKLIKRNI